MLSTLLTVGARSSAGKCHQQDEEGGALRRECKGMM